MKRWLSLGPFMLLVGFALIEMGAHAWTRARVPAPEDWQVAAAFVRAHISAGDLLVAAPGWADPLMRQALGDRVDLAMAGRSDSAAYERLWTLSIRGASTVEAPSGAPQVQQQFGGVRVQRYALGESPVRYDFVEHLQEAQVSISERACAWQKYPQPRGGGLGVGVLAPVERFGCEAKRTIWVAPVLLEDLDLKPRYCIYAPPPPGKQPLRLRFVDVPLGDRIVFYGGLYYEHERMREGGPVQVRALAQGRELFTVVHRDGDGWQRTQASTSGGRGDVTFEISAPDPHKRSFCWAATTQEGAARGGP